MSPIFIFFLLFFFSNPSFTEELCSSFDPRETQTIFALDSDRRKRGVTLEEFTEAIDRVEKVYVQIAKDRGHKLVFNRQWKSGHSNAMASIEKGGEWWVSLYGGLARVPTMTPLAFTAIACHEVGHFLGGAPKSQKRKYPWASIEGQADYFATSKCMRKIFSEEENLEYLNNFELSEFAKEKCQASFQTLNDQIVCYRSAQTSLELATVLKRLYGQRNAVIDFSTPDPTKTPKMIEYHTNAQCRLDTYFQGTLCAVSHEEPLSSEDPRPGACHIERGDQLGLRPQCWYLPRSEASSVAVESDLSDQG